MSNISKIKIDSDTYDIKDNLARFNPVTQNNFLSLNNGFNIIQYDVMATGNMIIGHIIVENINGYGNYNSIPFTINQGYKPLKLFYKLCGLGSSEWNVDDFGYLYMGGADCVVVSKRGTYNYAILDFSYEI